MPARHRGRELLRKLHKLAIVVREPGYRQALRQGVAAAIEHERVPFTQGFESVVDVGAGRGQFALVAHRRFPSARLHCFEPVSGARQKLIAVAGHFTNIRIYDVALGSGSGSAELHVSENLDSSSLLPMTAAHLSAFPDSAERERVTVQLARLDGVLTPDQLPGPSLMKVDAQGYELEVLQGAEGLLGHFAAILVECSFIELYAGQAAAEAVVRYLSERGLRFAGVFSPAYDETGRCLQADVLFERRADPGSEAVQRGTLGIG